MDRESHWVPVTGKWLADAMAPTAMAASFVTPAACEAELVARKAALVSTNIIFPVREQEKLRRLARVGRALNCAAAGEPILIQLDFAHDFTE